MKKISLALFYWKGPRKTVHLPTMSTRSSALLLFLLTSILALNSAAQEPATAPSAAGVEDSLDRQISDHQKVWLNDGQQAQLAFYLSETSGTAHGGVLLVPDLNKHPAGKGLIDTLRSDLSANHWHTLALKMRDTDEQQAVALIAAGIKHLNDQGVYNLAIIGEGLGAAQALHYVATLPPPTARNALNQIRAVILINGNNMIPGSKESTLEKLSNISVPILDAYPNGDFREQKQAEARQRAARRQMNKSYQQIRLPPGSNRQADQDLRISKRLRGWLDNNIAGFMVDRK